MAATKERVSEKRCRLAERKKSGIAPIKIQIVGLVFVKKKKKKNSQAYFVIFPQNCQNSSIFVLFQSFVFVLDSDLFFLHPDLYKN